MGSNQESRKIWKRPAFLIPCVVLLLILSVLSLLRFGNPQAHKYIYMFQAYVSPNHCSGWIPPPYTTFDIFRDGTRVGAEVRSVYTGRWVGWHKNGQKMFESNYRNGQEHETTTIWYSNGQKKSVENYRDGQLHGKHMHWHSNGQLQCEATYVQGKHSGTWKGWHENAQKAYEWNFKDGKMHGRVPYWDKSGQPLLVYHYDSGNLLKTEYPKKGNPEQTE